MSEQETVNKRAGTRANIHCRQNVYMTAQLTVLMAVCYHAEDLECQPRRYCFRQSPTILACQRLLCTALGDDVHISGVLKSSVER